MNLEKDSYRRSMPIRVIDLYETMYNNVKTLNKGFWDHEAIGFLGYTQTYAELFENVDRLADAYSKNGIGEGDAIGISAVNMPLVQENLLACSKLGATSVWLDVRNKEADLIKKLNETKCKILVAFDGVAPLVEKIIDKTNLSFVLVASPKDYLNPVIRKLADAKDKKEGKLYKLPNDKRFIKYSSFLKTGKKNSILKAVDFKKDRQSIIVQSSGSTGVSKSIVHTEYNFNSTMQKEAYTDMPLFAGKTIYSAIPPFIIYGLNNTIYAGLVFSFKTEMTPFVNETTIFNDLGTFDFCCGAPFHYRYIYRVMSELQQKIGELEKEIEKNLEASSVCVRNI